MSLATEAARWSVIAVTGMVGVFPDATTPETWRVAAGFGYAGNALDAPSETPLDDDADVAVTTRTGCDGGTIRPPRVTALTAVDSLSNSALESAERADLDSFEVRLERLGRGEQEGSLYRLFAYSNRGADAFAIDTIIIEYDSVPNDVDPMAADTASGTDCDGAHMRVPQLILHTAMDSLRNGSLLMASGGGRDAREVLFMTGDQLDVGNAVRLFLDQAGRGGDAYAIEYFEIEYDSVPDDSLMRSKEF